MRAADQHSLSNDTCNICGYNNLTDALSDVQLHPYMTAGADPGAVWALQGLLLYRTLRASWLIRPMPHETASCTLPVTHEMLTALRLEVIIGC
jgi:hypothetical protein